MRERNDSQISKGTLKLISLCLALLLELYFYSQDNSVTQLVSAVVEFQNIPENRIIVDPPHAEQGIPAHIEVYGPKSIVQQIASGFHVVKIPFPENAPFSFPIDVQYETLRFPPSVTIANAKPARLTVRTVELVRKEVPVEVTLNGEPAKGYRVANKKIFPKTVILKGPLQELQQVNKIVTEPVIISDLDRSSRFELRVTAPGEFSTLNVTLVGVDIELESSQQSDEAENDLNDSSTTK
jgi:YbbR domain-containing protein